MAWRFRIILLSIFMGGSLCLFEHYAWLSLRNYTIRSATPELERRFWALLPSAGVRFWPLFIRQSQNIGAFMERTIPVAVITEMEGWGTFSTNIRLLTPWLLVHWRNQVWCISKEGRMWNTAEPQTRVGGLEVPKKPLWKISPFFGSFGEDSGPLPAGVFPSIFPVEVFEEFGAAFGGEPWYKDLQEVVLERRAGADLFKLRLTRDKQEFAIWIHRSKYKQSDLNIALVHILSRLAKEGGNHLIDATYEDKIVVRKLSTGAGEGSSK